MKKKASPSPQELKPTALQSGRRKHPGHSAGAEVPAIVDEAALLTDLRELIQSARQRIATVANSTTTLLYWHLGRRLLTENLQDGRAAYGERILATVSRELTVEFGQAFTLRSLYRAIQFCQGFTDQEIVSTLSTQLSWSHFIELLPIKDSLARDFYAEMCRVERWDVRTLRQKIGGMLFQRTALSRKPEAAISAEIDKLRDGQMSPDTVFRDPYLPACAYWADGAVPALAGQARARAWRGSPDRTHPVRLRRCRAGGAARAGCQIHPRQRVPHGAAATAAAPCPAAPGDRTRQGTGGQATPQPGRSAMNTYEATSKAIISLARGLRDLQQQAAQQYRPVVDDILFTRSRDTRHIEHTLDRLLDFCGFEPVLEMYKQLCRHYWDIDPAATADYINAYREYWDSDAQEGPS